MSAYFSATETAFSTCNKIRLKNIAEKGNKSATLALHLSENYDKLLSAILVGNNIVNILATSVATIFFIRLLNNDQNLGSTISTVVMTVAVLIFGEISPKSIAKKYPEKFSMFSAPIMRAIMFILTPVTFIFGLWQKLLSKIFKEDDEQGITEEELISIIEEAEEDGGINEEESELIKNAIEFNDLEVGDIFTPRIDVTSVPSNISKDELAKVFADTGFSRLPVYEKSPDNIVGIFYHKDFFNTAFTTKVSLKSIIKPVIFVAMSMNIRDLLNELQEKQLHLAVVLDEYGSCAGIVTLEDILEEIVGEIWDEHDEVVEEIKKINDKEYIVSGKANIEKVLDMFDITEEPDSFTTNGWAMDMLGRMPEEGDRFEYLGLEVEVIKTDGRIVENLRIVDTREDEDEEKDKD